MKKFYNIIVLCVLFSTYAIAQDSNDNAFFFGYIPYFKECILKVSKDLTLQIAPDYTVFLSGEKKTSLDYTKEDITVLSKGSIYWDPQTGHLYLYLKGTISGFKRQDKPVYRYETKVDAGGVFANLVTLGAAGADNTKTEKVFDHTIHRSSSCSNDFEKTFMLFYKAGMLYLVDADGQNKLCTLSYSGDFAGETVSLMVSKEGIATNGISLEEKGSVIKDEFGDWQWNQEKTDIYLKACNTSNYLHMVVTDSIKKLYFVMNDTIINGVAENIVDSSNVIKQFEVYFDAGTPSSKLSFLAKRDTLVYATYNRFLSTWNEDATSLVQQIRDKNYLLLSYKKEAGPFLDVYDLEGLEIILQYL